MFIRCQYLNVPAFMELSEVLDRTVDNMTSLSSAGLPQRPSKHDVTFLLKRFSATGNR